MMAESIGKTCRPVVSERHPNGYEDVSQGIHKICFFCLFCQKLINKKDQQTHILIGNHLRVQSNRRSDDPIGFQIYLNQSFVQSRPRSVKAKNVASLTDPGPTSDGRPNSFNRHTVGLLY